MALSCYSSSNWGDHQLGHLNYSDINIFAADDQQPEYLPDILGLNNTYSNSLAFSDSHSTSIDPFFVASHNSFYSENYYTNIGNSSSTSSSLHSIFPENEYDPYSTTKRQKGHDGYYVNTSSEPEIIDINGILMFPSLSNSSFGFVDQNPPPSLLSPEILSPPFGPNFATNDINPPVFGGGGGGSEMMMNIGKKSGSGSGGSNGGGGTLSSQSIAARQRRRKITEKTQVLGKLIPGGQKMNTAEMFQAAYKYIKFLQAQVGVLESLASLHDQDDDDEESFHYQELNPLLGSSLIQEKLYSMEKCLVPEKFVQAIAKDSRIQPNSRALKDFKELIGGG